MKLTDLAIRQFPVPKSGQRYCYDDNLPGFGVRVSQGGARSFFLQHGSDRRLITLGRFPIITLAQARDEAKRILAEFTLGKVRPQSITFEQAVTLFLEDKARSKRPRTVAEYKRLLKHFPFKGQINNITAAWLHHRLSKLSNAPSEYNHALTAGKIFFNWAVKRRYILENPLNGLSGNKTTPRARVLSDKELKAIWHATEAPTTFNKLVRLALLTGQRRGELSRLNSNFIEDDICTLPAHLTKNGRIHSFPLAAVARQHLVVTNKPFSSWGKAKAALDKASGVTNWTIHDLRRTVATRLAELRTPPHVIERLLNHVTGQISGVAAVYNRATYLEEMRTALVTWEQHLRISVRASLKIAKTA